MSSVRIYRKGKDPRVWLNAAQKVLDVTSKETLRKAARKYNKIIRGHIDRQDLGLIKLSERTIKRKGHDKAYVETGEFYTSLRTATFKTSGKANFSVQAGPKLDKVHSASGLTNLELAKRLAYGYDKIPPRDIFTPSIIEWKRKVWTPLRKKLIAKIKG